ncbi:flavodoxin family protein [Parvularcula sp. IMCC14364]|uniref:flavodoxin family protein n=1 Tax=Parvularcula sp. IMCC14364 TaxID=3067902 RepID=UPI00274132BB|nr:NAD(P)H-dependent oxidoreductase [Parvularcula sp. IMCC14364]
MSEADSNILFLLGTSNPAGKTRALVDATSMHLPGSHLIDLGRLSIAPYDYDHRHEADDFSVVAEAVDAAQVIIFATPVYWYSMSAQLKVTFDRLTDLTETRKSVGKRLAGKTMFALVNGDPLPEGFLVPFSGTAGYFHMHWGGALNLAVESRTFPENQQARIKNFAACISQAAK